MNPSENGPDKEEEETEEEEGEIYRKSPVGFKSSYEQTDQLFLPLFLKKEWVWGSIGILVLFFLIWLFVGSIPNLAQGRGIVMNQKGLFTIEAQANGFVNEILVKPGQDVVQGELVSRIYDPEEMVKYQASLVKVQTLSSEFIALNKQVRTEMKAEKEALREEIAVTKQTIQQLQDSIPPLEKELATKENLLKQQLIGLKDVQETRQLLIQRRIAVATAQGTLATLEANIAKSYREQELRDKQQELTEAKQQSELLKLSLHYHDVYSPSAGHVLEILVTPGAHVSSGAPLFHLEYLEKSKRSHLFFAYLPVEIGKQVKVGTKFEIALSTVSAQQYGEIVGHVIAVSPYPVSKENIASSIQNDRIVEFLTQGAPSVVQIVIQPLLDPNSPTGYKWTSGGGPEVTITTGTIGTVNAIIGYEKPIFYFFPLWKISKLFTNGDKEKSYG